MSDRRGENIHAISAVDALGLPMEVSVLVAAGILGVDKKTVRKYVQTGRLRWRNVGTGGRPMIRIELASVLAMRTTYQTSEPSTPPPPRRRVTRATRNYKHVTIRR